MPPNPVGSYFHFTESWAVLYRWHPWFGRIGAAKNRSVDRSSPTALVEPSRKQSVLRAIKVERYEARFQGERITHEPY
jgi:hypothetical protein